MDQYPKIESIGSIGSNIFAILEEVQVVVFGLLVLPGAAWMLLLVASDPSLHPGTRARRLRPCEAGCRFVALGGRDAKKDHSP